MKKILIITTGIFVIFCVYSCNKKIPSEPAYPTPNATQTEMAVLAAIATQTEVAVLVFVPGGTFTQSDGTNSFIHTISGFKIGKYEATYELWYTVYQWAIANGYSFENTGGEGWPSQIDGGAAPTIAEYNPVIWVFWRDTAVWCNAYSQMMGLSPVYYSDSGFTLPIKDSTDFALSYYPYADWNANGFRLPTEGEWQYAASYIDGSNWTPWNYASGALGPINNVTETFLVAWYYWNCTTTKNVGTKKSNALGIFDMSGNVQEWCWDWYGAWPTGTVSNYHGPSSGSDRVLRGGGIWGLEVLTVGSRESCPSNNLSGDMGFRIAKNN